MTASNRAGSGALALILRIGAAELRNLCRRSGVQLGTIDALLAQLCVRHSLTLLTTDNDFACAARHCDLNVWGTGHGAPGRYGLTSRTGYPFTHAHASGRVDKVCPA